LVKQTSRGFNYIEFTDKAGTQCNLQESSSAEEPSIWLGAENIGLKEFVAFRAPSAWEDRPEFDEFDEKHHFVANNRMHLNQEQVKALLPYLQRFVETGAVCEEGSEEDNTPGPDNAGESVCGSGY